MYPNSDVLTISDFESILIETKNQILMVKRFIKNVKSSDNITAKQSEILEARIQQLDAVADNLVLYKQKLDFMQSKGYEIRND